MRRIPSLLLTGLFLLLASTAFAAPQFGISIFTGYQGYQMGQINNAINNVQDALSEPAERAEIDNLTGAMSLGGAVRVDLNPLMRVYVEYEHLGDKTGFGNNLGTFHLEPEADVIILGGTYFLPSTSTTRFGVGGGVGIYTFSGNANSTVSWYTTTTSASVDLGGDTVGFHVRGEMELTLTPQWQLDAGLGYRWAQGDLTVAGHDSGVDLDWSGLMTRIGFTFVLGAGG
jgi:hypothetical protein